MVNVLLEVSAHDGRAHYEPGLVQLPDLAFAARVVSNGHGAVVIVGEADEAGEAAAAEADLPHTLAALQVKPGTDAAAAVERGLATRAGRLAKAARKAATKAGTPATT